MFFHITQSVEFICDKSKILIGVKFKNKWVFGQIASGNFELNKFFLYSTTFHSLWCMQLQDYLLVCVNILMNYMLGSQWWAKIEIILAINNFQPIKGRLTSIWWSCNECKLAYGRNAWEFVIKFQWELWIYKKAKVHTTYEHNSITNHFSELFGRGRGVKWWLKNEFSLLLRFKQCSKGYPWGRLSPLCHLIWK